MHPRGLVVRRQAHVVGADSSDRHPVGVERDHLGSLGEPDLQVGGHGTPCHMGRNSFPQWRQEVDSPEILRPSTRAHHWPCGQRGPQRQRRNDMYRNRKTAAILVVAAGLVIALIFAVGHSLAANGKPSSDQTPTASDGSSANADNGSACNGTDLLLRGGQDSRPCGHPALPAPACPATGQVAPTDRRPPRPRRPRPRTTTPCRIPAVASTSRASSARNQLTP